MGEAQSPSIHEALRQLVAAYAVAVARGDLDALVNLFVADVRVASGVNGRAALREVLGRSLRQTPVSILNIGTHHIELIDADNARGTLFCKGEMGDAGRWIHQLIVYEDRYERRDGRWQFRTRKHRLVYGQVQPDSPLAQPPANWPERDIGSGDAPMHWPSWQALHGSGSSQ